MFLHRLTEKHDIPDTVFLVDGYENLTALFRLELSGQLDYVERNLIEKWFHTLKMRVDRFHNSWVGSRASVREWLELFVHYYNIQRSYQSLNGQTPAEVDRARVGRQLVGFHSTSVFQVTFQNW